MAQKKKLFNRMSCVHQLSAESPAPLTYSQRRAPQQHRDRGRTLGISSLCQLPPREIGGQPFKPQYCSGWVVEPSWMPLLLGVRSKLPFNESFGSIMQNIQKLVVSNGFQPISKKTFSRFARWKFPQKYVWNHLVFLQSSLGLGLIIGNSHNFYDIFSHLEFEVANKHTKTNLSFLTCITWQHVMIIVFVSLPFLPFSTVPCANSQWKNLWSPDHTIRTITWWILRSRGFGSGSRKAP